MPDNFKGSPTKRFSRIHKIAMVIFVFSMMLVFALESDSAVFARNPAQDPEGTLQAFLKNTGFENGVIDPWLKKPDTAQGVFWAECNQGHSAVGNCNAGLTPLEAGDIMMQQRVAVVQAKYNLQVRVSTTGGITAQLEYKMNGVVTVCKTTHIQFPSWKILDCDIDVQSGTNAVVIRLRALAAPAGQKVYADDWSFTRDFYSYRQASQNSTWTNQTYKGVNAMISVPRPIIREPVHSYSTIHLLTTGADHITRGIEAGLLKGPSTQSPCQTQIEYSFSSGGWLPQYALIDTSYAGEYEFSIVRTGFETWRVNVWDEFGTLVWQSVHINIAGFDEANEMIAGGEVFSSRQQNDLGVSQFTNLRYKQTGSNNWVPWDRYLEVNRHGDGFAEPPYFLGGIAPDARNNIEIWGNNGNPIIPGSPCPNP